MNLSSAQDRAGGILAVAVAASLGGLDRAVFLCRTVSRAISAPPSANFGWAPTNWVAIASRVAVRHACFACCSRPAAALLSTLMRPDRRRGGIPGRTLGALRHRRHRSVSVAALAVPAAGCAGLAAAQHVARDIGDDHLSAARMFGLGRARAHHPRRHRTLVNSDYLVQASASGISRWRFSGATCCPTCGRFCWRNSGFRCRCSS
jgi:hypothetical protein